MNKKSKQKPEIDSKPSPVTKDPAGHESPIDDLAKFLNREHSEELSEFKESLNKGLGILVVIDDDETGIPLHLFAQGEDSSILSKKALRLDKERRRSIRALLEWIESFEIMAKKVFKDFANYLSGRIDSIKTNAEKQIEVIDNVLSATKSAAKASGAGAATIAAVEKKKSRLKSFIDRLTEHNENLENAKSTEELLEVETELEEDVVAYDKNTTAKKNRNGLNAFFTGLYANVPNIESAFPEIEEELFDVFDEPELDIDPYAPVVDEDDEGETGTSDTIEEELTY